MKTLEATRETLARRGLVSIGMLLPPAVVFLPQLGLGPSILATLALIVLGFALGWLPWWPQARRWSLPMLFGLYAAAVGLPTTGFLTGAMATCVLACTLTTLLFGTRPGFAVTAVMALTLVVSGWLHSRGVYTLLPGVADLTKGSVWVRTGLILAVLSVLPMQAMLGFVQELSETARSRVVALVEIEREHSRYQQAEHARRGAHEEARRAQRQRTIGRMAGGLAHEINGALQEAEGWLEVLRQVLPAGENASREALSQMSISAARAAAIGRRLLLVGGDHVAQAERTDLCAFLVGLRGTLAAVLGPDRKLELAASGDFVAMLDPVELAHVLVNLAANARDAMPEGGTLTVVLREPTHDERVQGPGSASAIDVTDAGTGMSPEFVQKIFDPFFSTKGAAGTGLGLSSVRHLVEAAGGLITVRSAIGRGTTFTVLLPRPAGAEASRAATRLDTVAVAAEPNAEGPLVLFVEDEPGIREVFERLLTQAGLRLDVASDVTSAIACLARRIPDLIWTDAVLPGRPTRELIAEARRVASDVPVVVCSGHVAEELLRRDLRAGDLEFVPKPYSAEKLVERARTAAAARRAGRAECEGV